MTNRYFDPINPVEEMIHRNITYFSCYDILKITRYLIQYTLLWFQSRGMLTKKFIYFRISFSYLWAPTLPFKYHRFRLNLPLLYIDIWLFYGSNWTKIDLFSLFPVRCIFFKIHNLWNSLNLQHFWIEAMISIQKIL